VRLLVVQQQPDAPAGLVADWAAARGGQVDVVHAPTLRSWPDPTGVDAIVALGSDRSVHASRDPWIAEQVAFLRAAHDGGTPVLGICFGGQALAAALGGVVSRAPETEIGWIEVEGGDGFGGRWFTWHEDVFTLPPGAEELARAGSGLQAFAVGPSVGLQFHPEVTPAIVDDWLADARDGVVADPQQIRGETSAAEDDVRGRAFALLDRISARWRR
jgi:GMP synthase-like glutamine amidotransferase